MEHDDVVVVFDGPDAGVIGLYDDDEYEDGTDWMVVYPSIPHLTPYLLVHPGCARKATDEEEAKWRVQHENELADRRALNQFREKEEG